jgi:ABC-type lipoprotein export system ATPase subunit
MLFTIILRLVKSSITWPFILNSGLLLLVDAIISPYIMNIYFSSFLDDDVYNGIIYFITYHILDLIFGLYKSNYIDSYNTDRRYKIKNECTKIYNEKLCSVSFENQKELCKKDIFNDYWKSIGSITSFVIDLHTVIFDSLTYICKTYIYWYYGYFTFWSILLFMSVPFIVMIYEQCVRRSMKDKKTNDNYIKLGFLSNSFLQYTFHREENDFVHNYDYFNDQIRKAVIKRNAYERNIHSEISGIIYILNFIIFRPNTCKEILKYLQFSSMIQHGIYDIIEAYQNYKDTKIEFTEIYKSLFSLKDKIKVNDICPSEKITLLPFRFKRDVFTLRSDEKIIFNVGNIYLLRGDSGHGKSTFVDILCNVITTNVIKYKIDNQNVNSFDHITNFRQYVIQGTNLPNNASIYESVSYDLIGNNRRTCIHLVEKALVMAECDFTNNLDKINNELSGGQRNRLRIANAIFRLLKNDNIRFIILDEIDSMLPAKLSFKIMNNIYEYCRKNKITCIVVAHTTEVQQMNYDDIFQFTNGNITKI